MWTDMNRAKYDRDGPRYSCDLTDEEWAYIKPLIPRAKRGGNKRTVNLRDTERLLLRGLVTPASVQDRDGGIALLATLFGLFPFLAKVFADSAYGGPLFKDALADILPCIDVEVIKRSDRAKGFVVLPRRWVVERTIAWLIAAAGSPRIGKTAIGKRSHSSNSPQFASCRGSSAIVEKVRRQTLSLERVPRRGSFPSIRARWFDEIEARRALTFIHALIRGDNSGIN